MRSSGSALGRLCSRLVLSGGLQQRQHHGTYQYQLQFLRPALTSATDAVRISSQDSTIGSIVNFGGGWGSRGVFAGAASFSFTVSAMSTVAAKERPLSENIPKEVTLYQYEACPFCNKVKAFLDYHDVPYHVVEVNPIGKKEIKWSEYQKVPILVVDGDQLNDSTAIISILNEKLNPKPKPNEAKEEEEKWRRWVDEHLVHLLSPNIYRTPSEALEAFDYITKNGKFTAFERLTGKYVGATAMYMIGKRLKKRHNITDERAALYEAANAWVDALSNRSFMGGSKPNLADLAVFGVLRPIRHLQAGVDMISNSKIGPWYARMEEAVGEPSRVD